MCYVQMSGLQVVVVGMVNGQLKMVVLICGVQFKGEICRLEGEESDFVCKVYNCCFLVVRMLLVLVWEIWFDEIKFIDNMLGFGKKMIWLCDLGIEQV